MTHSRALTHDTTAYLSSDREDNAYKAVSTEPGNVQYGWAQLSVASFGLLDALCAQGASPMDLFCLEPGSKVWGNWTGS